MNVGFVDSLSITPGVCPSLKMFMYLICSLISSAIWTIILFFCFSTNSLNLIKNSLSFLFMDPSTFELYELVIDWTESLTPNKNLVYSIRISSAFASTDTNYYFLTQFYWRSEDNYKFNGSFIIWSMLSITLSWETWLINRLLNLSEARCCSLRSINLSLFRFYGSRYGFSFIFSIYIFWFLLFIKFAFFFTKFMSFMLSGSLNISNYFL